MNTFKNKAQELSYQSAKFAQAQDKEAWLGLFADDGVVQDPVGKSPLDPVGDGHKGKEAIGAFFDMTIGSAQITMNVLSSHPSGDSSCANVIDITTQYPNGAKIVVTVVSVYTTNEDGVLATLQAYWDFDIAMQQLA